MKRMFYKCSVDGPSDIELVNLAKAQEITSQYIKNQKDFYEDADLAILESMFGFHETSSDFIEISIDSKVDYRIRLECKVPKSLWFISYSSLYQKEYKLNSPEKLNAIVGQFFAHDVLGFKAYFDNLNYEISPPLRFS